MLFAVKLIYGRSATSSVTSSLKRRDLFDWKRLLAEEHKAALGDVHQIAEKFLSGLVVNPSIVKKVAAFDFASVFHIFLFYTKYTPDDCAMQSRDCFFL